MSKIKLLIVDDDPFIRESLTLLIGMDPDIQVIGSVSNGAEAVDFVQGGGQPNVVLMDIRMPICDGVEGARRIKAISADISVLMLTTFDDDEFILEALRNGASGYLLKNIPPDRIIQGVKTVHSGSMLIHPDVARKLSGLLRPSVPTPPADKLSAAGLTTAEHNVVSLIADGMSNKEIAQQLYLSEGTVKNHITEILGKLGVRDRTQIAILYWKGQQTPT
ncbi:response regulator [Paenibacillus segetis]|uniref:DNA-binding response regulator n=1 Tax=Paenibacillus segetis TaxID=1325360 RepID=A0ABQ1YT85_9BACL|nr:response regulator transcription factor [Paenibacillus segetis]GGH37645.1 DNA-binding response regulator [Paenibacillus segetis]